MVRLSTAAAVPLLLLGAASGCAATPEPVTTAPASCETSTDTQVVVVTGLGFAGHEDGASLGFDLDQHVSDFGDDEGCGKADVVSPDGEEGVDNAFGQLLPVLEQTQFAAVEGLVQGLIITGELLIMTELEAYDPDDSGNDPCQNVNLLQGIGEPILGTDGVVAAGQTFERDTQADSSRVEGVSMAHWRTDAGPIELDLPLQVFDVFYVIPLSNGMVRWDALDDGTWTGVIGGSIQAEYISEIAATDGVGQEFEDTINGLLTAVTDMDADGDGTCESISVALQLDGVDAFFYD